MTLALEMVDRSCPLCGSTDQSHVFAEARFDAEKLDQFAFASRKTPEYMHHRLIACPVCDLVYATPVPVANSLAKAYQDAAFDSSDESRYASVTYGRLLSKIMPTFTDRQGAVDIGTGDGAFLHELLARGFTDVVGIEPSKAPIASAGTKIRSLIRYGPFESQRLEPERYCLVTCFQTLEHLSDPMQMCRGVFEWLKNDGIVFLVCHNRRALSARLLGIKSPIFDIEHLQLFSPRSLEFLLSRSGFSGVTVTSFWNTYPLGYWLKLLPIPNMLKRPSLSIFKKLGMGALPVSIPAGNIVAAGYKRAQKDQARRGAGP